MAEIKKGVTSGACAGLISGALFVFINVVLYLSNVSYTNFSFNAHSILLLIVFIFLCGLTGLLCGALYVILDSGKNRALNKYVKFLIIFFSFFSGELIISSFVFNYPEVISALISSVFYCWMLELLLRKFEWDNLYEMLSGMLQGLNHQ